MTGADILASNLENLGISHAFCITGAGNLAIIDSISRRTNIKLIFVHHEQAAVMAAQGFSRITGKIGLAIVTTGGGTSNALTGLLSAYLDSIPVLMISGNESSFHCRPSNGLRAFGVQGFDSVKVSESICKFAVRVETIEDLNITLSQAVFSMFDKRRGPAHIDFPMDLQRKSMSTELTNIINMSPVEAEPIDLSTEQLKLQELVENLLISKKPVLYIGNGCRNAFSKSELEDLLSKLNIPFFLSWSGLDLVNEDHVMNFGRIGIYGDQSANIALQNSDMVICIGTRLAIPQIGYDPHDFGRNASKWVIDIDPSELAKFESYGWTLIESTSKRVLSHLGQISSKLNKDVLGLWIAEVEMLQSQLPRNNL